ncbi:HDOD domain-containing protein [Thiorhodovibrio litoralis]|uniref:HDOD domain-containing protein n=1 Tax=Thiorhodovibrio litoralis TaxID=2952932 RepID=UPI002B261199|nr:HDOD domain-containing protein [Thiorhodovibrio litoralis]WPL13135.1 HDOD domain protein [Thiorhodovibrio litoralis]
MAPLDRSSSSGRALPATLNAWTNFLTDTELPAFARTVSEVTRIAGDPEASAYKLASAITKDAAMAARLVKLANSPLFPSSHGNIQTVDRGVVLLGFDAVRDLAVSLSVIEQVIRGQSRDALLEEMALAFHTATQSQTLARLAQDKESAEIFVAGLLYRIGVLAVLSSPDPRVEDYLAEKADFDPNEAVQIARMEKRVFGCDMTQLSRRLAQHWSLGQVLQEALAPDPSQAGERIAAGRRIAEVAMRRGWESKEANELLSRVARKIGLKLSDIREKVHESSEVAREMAAQFGATKVAPLIPQTAQGIAKSKQAESAARDGRGTAGSANTDAAETEGDAGTDGRFLRPDPLLQLQMLGRMAELLNGKPDLNRLVHTAVEGVHRGIGMDRTVFALLTGKQDAVAAKFVLTEIEERLQASFRFSLRPEVNPLLAAVIGQRKAFWVRKDSPPDERKLVRGPFAQFVAKEDFVIHPVLFGDKCIGFLYADRANSHRPIESSDEASFRQFIQQLTLGLRLLGVR